MATIIIIVIVIAVLAIKFANQFEGKKVARTEKAPVQYHYQLRISVMTDAENRFFDVLSQAVASEYYVFPQLHVSSILDQRVNTGKWENWDAAFNHINGKSVDYVLCDKVTRRPLLAIELGDWSHDKEDRQTRDTVVEQLLQETGIPLLRFKDVRDLSSEQVAVRIRSALTPQVQCVTRQ